ncbi:MAG: Na+/H+ antiporter subunit E [Chromatiales bacterium]|nr:Na+/H+ antiporter subunit E [Gammaproteobacteria bacterium]
MDNISREPPLTLPHYLFIFATVYLLWLLLVGELSRQELILGGLVSLVVTLVSAPHLLIFGGVKLRIDAPLHLLRYLGYFFVALIRANLDMARRILSPSLPINPRMVEVETGLRSTLGRLMLANSITLTPGTLSVDVKDNRILVHWVDASPGVDLEAATREIAAGFERHLGGFLR